MDKPYLYTNVSAIADAETNRTTRLPAKLFSNGARWTRERTFRRRALAISLYVLTISCLAVLATLAIGGLGVNAAPYNENICYHDLESGVAQFIGYNVFIVQNVAFTTAKLIDIFVQLVIGQGGRALHAWIAYRVFPDAITRSLEQTPAPYPFVLSAKFDPTSLSSIGVYAKSVFRNASARQRWLALWFLGAAAFVLAFPTLVNASTGYFSPLDPYYEMPNGLLLSYDQWRRISGYSGTGFRCYGVSQATGNLLANASLVSDTPIENYFGNALSVLEELDCGGGWKDMRCVQASGYIWGLSTWMIIIFVSLEAAWISGMFGVWWDANVKSEMNRNFQHRNGLCRSIMDVSEAMANDLGPHHCLHDEKSLERSLRRAKVGLGMSARADNLVHVGMSSQPSSRIQLVEGARYG